MALRERKDVPEKYKWNTGDLFSTEEEFDKTYASAERAAEELKTYAGKLKKPDKILEFLKKQDEAGKMLERIYVYAHMKKDQDTRDGAASQRKARAEALYVKFSSATAFFTPELLSLSDGELKSIIAAPEFSDYDYSLKCLLKQKKHVLSEREERLLAMGGEVYSSFSEIFSVLDNADLPLPAIRHNGEKIVLSHGVYGQILHGEDRELRKKAFKAYYKAYMGLINTITSNYLGSVKKDVFLAKARNYNSCLEKALSGEDVPVEVYENLLESVKKALPALHRYIAVRKSALGLDKMHMYDLYAPISENAELKLDYDEAYELVTEGLKPLGEEYCALLKKAYAERWIDVEETAGKRSGAYSTSAFGVHPYVLLNYTRTTHDVFTIAHEMGHAIHSYRSSSAQPYAKADYRIFVAEVASTVNEVLLLKHITSKTKDAKLKKYLLAYYLDMLRTTLFRQTMFAEFEAEAHSRVESGKPQSKETLNALYLKLNKKYYGKSVVHDGEIAYEWCRIPHFYTSFYVYKYATGIISAVSIAERILSEGSAAVEDYMRFLSSGGSDSPVELLKIAGVDLTSAKPFEDAMAAFEDTLGKLEKAL